jgi:hypothetical protein
VFAKKPHLEFVRAEHLADQHVIRSVVADVRCPPRQNSGLTDNDLVRIEQTGELYRDLLAATWRRFYVRRLSHGLLRERHPSLLVNGAPSSQRAENFPDLSSLWLERPYTPDTGA